MSKERVCVSVEECAEEEETEEAAPRKARLLSKQKYFQQAPEKNIIKKVFCCWIFLF